MNIHARQDGPEGVSEEGSRIRTRSTPSLRTTPAHYHTDMTVAATKHDVSLGGSALGPLTGPFEVSSVGVARLGIHP